MSYELNSCMPSNEWEYVRVIVLKISGALSCLGSGSILQFVWKKWRRRRGSVDPYQRIMAALSAYDMLTSFFVFVMHTWMTPRETGWWGAAGNVYTCSAQGFFFLFGYIGVSAYQALFSTQMVLIVVYNWTRNKFERKVERHMHVVILAAATAIGLVPLFTKTYNPSCGFCLAVPTPLSCVPLSVFAVDGVECVRGSATIALVINLFLIGFVLMVVVYCCAAMYVIYRDVRKQEDRMNQYSFGGEEHNRESRRIRTTMLLYTSSFFLCWIIPIVVTITIVGDVPTSKIVTDVLLPLQGFFNMVVFFRPKYLKYQKDNPGTSLLVAYVRVVLGTPAWVKAVRRMFSSLQTTNPNTDDDEEIDDGIGFNNYNEEPPDTHEASRSNDGDRAESNVPPNDQ